MSYDITIAFDKAEYLNPQIYMFIDTLKDNIPKDTILHVVTNRSRKSEVIKYIKDNINSKIYFNNGYKTNSLKSRCRYMLNCFDIKTDKDWVIKMELDMLTLLPISNFEKELTEEYDLVIEPENRKIFSDNVANRLWRIIYKRLGIECPIEKIVYRENDEEGLPLYGTGIVAIKSKHLDTINKRWIELTKICEIWISMNIHPNEMAFTALSFDEGWNTKLYKDIFKFNPIGHFRKGDFPSIELVENCTLPEDVMCFDYHRPEWLFHVSKWNPKLKEIIKRNKHRTPKDWWKLTTKDFQEGLI